jgi:ketosteroid isomerase-like protein
MPEENVTIVERAIAAINERALEHYLACCTEDVQLVTPAAEIGAVYEGKEAISRFFADLSDTSPDFHIEIEGLEAIGSDRVLGLLRVFATGRASGIPAVDAMPTGNIYDIVDGKIARIRIFMDRDEALKAARLPE